MEPTDGFLERYQDAAPALHAFASLRCRGPLGQSVEPEDLVQETCIAAFREYARFVPERGSFRAWLLGIATKLASDAMRRTARRERLAPKAPDDGSVHGVPALITTLSRRVRRDEALEQFLAAAAELPEDDRWLLIHRGLEGLDHAEVARLLGVSAEVSAKRWQRLRDRLRTWPAAQGLLVD